MKNNKSNSNGLQILLGAAAGAMIGYFMASDSGRKFRKDAIDKLDEVNNTLKANYDTTSKKLASKYEDVKSEASSLAGTLKTKADTFAEAANSKMSSLKSKTADNIETLETNYKEGLDKAKEKLNGIKEEL